MNNDFGRSHLPCSPLSENTAFMIMIAFVHNYYRHFVGKLSGLGFGLAKTSRVKRFVFSFISVPFKWVAHNAGKVLLLFTDNADYYEAAGVTAELSRSPSCPRPGWGELRISARVSAICGLQKADA